MKNIDLSILFILFILNSCVNSKLVSRPVSSQVAENNKTYEVDFLFEHDGCKVYRFYDCGNFVYFTNCQNNVSSIVNDSTQIKTISNLSEKLNN